MGSGMENGMVTWGQKTRLPEEGMGGDIIHWVDCSPGRDSLRVLERGPCKVHHEERELCSCFSQDFHRGGKEEQLLSLMVENGKVHFFELSCEARFIRMKSYFLKLTWYW